MRKLVVAGLAIAAVGLMSASTASAGLPKPKDTKRIDVPESIAGVELGMKIKRADRSWGNRGNCDFKGRQDCRYVGRNPRAGSAVIEAAKRGKVSSFGIFAGLDGDHYTFRGKLLRFHAKRGIGLGDKGAKVRRAFPKAIRTANDTGWIVEGKGRSYMTFQTLGGKRITGITVVDGDEQG